MSGIENQHRNVVFLEKSTFRRQWTYFNRGVIPPAVIITIIKLIIIIIIIIIIMKFPFTEVIF